MYPVHIYETFAEKFHICNLQSMFDFQKHRNYKKSYRLIIRIVLYGLITGALLFLMLHQQSKMSRTDPSPLEIQEIKLSDSLFIIEESM